MRKLNSIILTGVLILTTLSGCGMPGALYQEPKKDQTTQTKTQDNQTESNEQQEP